MSLADELQKFQQLRESGAITEEEFQRNKARLLAEAEAREAPPRTVADPEREARQWAFFLHLSQYAHVMVPLGGIILPVVLWQLKKDEFPGVDVHGKNVVNWAISMCLYMLVGIPLCFVLVGIPFVILLAIAGLVCPLISAIKASNGVIWHYPGTITFLK
jgi:uncharacterized protein